MEFIFAFAIVQGEVFTGNFLKIMKVIRAFGIYTFMHSKVFSVLFGNQCVGTVWTAEFQQGAVFFFRRKTVLADFAQDLTFGTVIFIKIRFWCMTAWALTVIADITFRTPSDWLDGFVGILITPGKVLHEILIIPRFNRVKNEWKFINLEFLVLRGMGIIKSPLLERYISTDKI